MADETPTPLIDFLRARLDEDERIARAAGRPRRGGSRADRADEDYLSGAGVHIARWLPSRVLDEVAAKRRILDIHATADNGQGRPDSQYCEECFQDRGYNASSSAWPVWCRTVRILAQPYRSHPDFNPDWEVTE